MKKVKFFPLYGKNKKKIYFFPVNTKNISCHVFKISAISRVRSTREIADIFNTFNEIYLVFTPKKSKYPLFICTFVCLLWFYTVKVLKVGTPEICY